MGSMRESSRLDSYAVLKRRLIAIQPLLNHNPGGIGLMESAENVFAVSSSEDLCKGVPYLPQRRVAQ